MVARSLLSFSIYLISRGQTDRIISNFPRSAKCDNVRGITANYQLGRSGAGDQEASVGVGGVQRDTTGSGDRVSSVGQSLKPCAGIRSQPSQSRRHCHACRQMATHVSRRCSPDGVDIAPCCQVNHSSCFTYGMGEPFVFKRLNKNKTC